uniref:Ig-like domain-containing protein n=1 Tax=Cyclopterus lumpus TaxID=8103 RepID=A0A8C3GC49_CYCLU
MGSSFYLTKRTLMLPRSECVELTLGITVSHLDSPGLTWTHLDSPVLVSDVIVTCLVSEECLLPCSFQPGSKETIEWFRQEVMVYKLDSSEEEEPFEHEHFAGRASVSRQWISRGNATLILRRSGLKDRGTYRCHVLTLQGEHNAKVIVKVAGELMEKKKPSWRPCWWRTSCEASFTERFHSNLRRAE